MKEEPIYKHDCDRCKFMGNVARPAVGYSDRKGDLYICRSSPNPTIIMRVGDAGNSYETGLYLAPYLLEKLLTD